MCDELTSETIALVDTNLFVAIGGPTNSKFHALREYVRDRDVVLKVPPRVERELSTMHYGDRVDVAVEEGWAERIDPPSPTDPDAVAAMDFVRREIAKQTDKDEHEVEKADTALAGLAVEYLERNDAPVAILTDDRVAASAIKLGTACSNCDGSVTVFTRSDLIGDGDDDLRIL